MNKVILIGRITKDPEVRYSQNGTSSYLMFTLAIDRGSRDASGQRTADFISCIAFGKTADFIEGYAHQGTKFVVCGRIQTGSYTNKDGAKVYTTDVVVEEVDFAESKANAAATGGSRPNPASADGFMNIDDSVEDEGMPFN